MFRYFLISGLSIFLFLPKLDAQVKHEAKIDVFELSSSSIRLNYEVMFAKSIAIEVGCFYTTRNASLAKIDTSGINVKMFGQRRLSPSIAGKFYFGEKSKFRGFYMGPYFSADYLISRDRGYLEEYEDFTGNQIPDWDREEAVFKSINYGLILGYKWIIKDHFIIEFSIEHTIEKAVGVGASELSNYREVGGRLDIGYRF